MEFDERAYLRVFRADHCGVDINELAAIFESHRSAVDQNIVAWWRTWFDTLQGAVTKWVSNALDAACSEGNAAGFEEAINDYD